MILEPDDFSGFALRLLTDMIFYQPEMIDLLCCEQRLSYDLIHSSLFDVLSPKVWGVLGLQLLPTHFVWDFQPAQRSRIVVFQPSLQTSIDIGCEGRS